MIDLLGIATAAVIAVGILRCPPERHGRGRHVSRPLGRLLGWSWLRVYATQCGVLFALGAALIFVPGSDVGVLGWVLDVMQVALAAWIVDDWATGHKDDEGHRKHEWAKVRLRMPKPVKLRPVERVPVPA